MKKVMILATILAVSAGAMAKGGYMQNDNRMYDGKGGYQGFFDESQAKKTVADTLKANDNSFVMLEGKIVKQIDDDEFIFQDATGEIEIDVSKRAWNGQNIGPQDTVQIRGKVDKEWNKTEIDVKQIIKK